MERKTSGWAARFLAHRESVLRLPIRIRWTLFLCGWFGTTFMVMRVLAGVLL